MYCNKCYRATGVTNHPSILRMHGSCHFHCFSSIFTCILLISFCLVYYCKSRKVGKGNNGMDIEDGGRHNKSDIYYNTEDAESIMNEMDNTFTNEIQYTQAKTPIFTPKTIRHLARVDKSIGSIGSLLEDDDFLDKGYQEDGSFRERYAE